MTVKVLNVSNGDYKVSVRPSGSVIFDTRGPNGLGSGQVSILGELVVDGSVTYISSEQLEIQDRIITLNKGESGPGITGSHTTDPGLRAGLEIKRGGQTNYQDAYFYFNEDLDHKNSLWNTVNGSFEFKIGVNRAGIYATSINVGDNEDLYLINQGTGVISVKGTVDYEQQVTDDDDIPNRRFLTNYVAATGGSAAVDRFYAFDLNTVSITDTGGQAYDIDTGANQSKVIFNINGIEKAKVGEDHLQVPITYNGNEGRKYLTITTDGTNGYLTVIEYRTIVSVSRSGGVSTITVDSAHNLTPGQTATIRCVSTTFNETNVTLLAGTSGTTIVYTNAGSNLSTSSITGTVSFRGSGSVKINSNINTTETLQLGNQTSTPTPNNDYNVLYSKSSLGMGKTGLYFTNPKTSDELVSRRRALGFSMIF